MDSKIETNLADLILLLDWANVKNRYSKSLYGWV